MLNIGPGIHLKVKEYSKKKTGRVTLAILYYHIINRVGLAKLLFPVLFSSYFVCIKSEV
jgi:hypothetical protein